MGCEALCIEGSHRQWIQRPTRRLFALTEMQETTGPSEKPGPWKSSLLLELLVCWYRGCEQNLR